MGGKVVHYYPHHIGDFISDTARLTDSQCMAYLRLIWHYYDTEKPLQNDPDSLAFIIGASVGDVNLILKHYFILDGDCWRKTRCDSVIAEYHGKAEKAKKSADARWKKAKGKQSESECNANASTEDANESKTDANQKPITNNQKPIEDQKIITPQAAPPAAPEKKSRKPKTELDYSVWGESIDQQLLTDWLTVRRTKRAAVTQTVLDTAGSEFRKAASFGYTVNDCLRCWVAAGWQGFKFEWMQNQLTKTGGNHAGQPKSPIERFMRKHYPNAGPGPENDHGPMGRDDGPVRGAMDSELRGDTGRIRPMDQDLIGDFSRSDS